MNFINSQTLTGHLKAVNSLAVISNDKIVSGSDDESLKIWDVTSGKEISTLNGHCDSVNCVAVIDKDRIVRKLNYFFNVFAERNQDQFMQYIKSEMFQIYLQRFYTYLKTIPIKKK